MKALTQQDLIPHDEYERRRETYRQAIIELKRRRRIGLGVVEALELPQPAAVAREHLQPA